MMSLFFFIGAVIAMILTLIIVCVGVFSMAKNEEFRKKYGNKLMKARVMMQAAAVLMLILAFWTA